MTPPGVKRPLVVPPQFAAVMEEDSGLAAK
jgi:hypothetical protein